MTTQAYDETWTTHDPIVYKSFLTTNYFTARSLTRGVYYKFWIQSRTEYGYSDYSDPIELLCAIPPEATGEPSNSIDGGVCIVEWPSTVDNGSPIIDYKIFVKHS